MPTSRRRFMITESEAVRDALADAAKRWPDVRDRPAVLLARLIEEGHQALRADDTQRCARRRAAVERTAGALTGCFPAGYLDELRGDWPA